MILLKTCIQIDDVSEAAHEQESSSYQYKRERDLGDDESSPHQEMIPAGGCSTRAGFERRTWLGLGRLNRRREPKQDAGQNRQAGGESEHTPVGSQFHKNWVLLRAQECDQRTAQDLGQADASERPQRGKQQALRKQLADQPAPRCPERQPYVHLALARARAS